MRPRTKAALLVGAASAAVGAGGAGAADLAQFAAAPQLDGTTLRCAGEATSALSALRPLPSRSPSGLLYERPRMLGPQHDPASWLVGGCAEVAWLADDGEPSAQFRRYRDPDEQSLGGAFSLLMEPAARDRFVEFDGGRLGRNDLYLGLRAARYNDWSLAARYEESPQVTGDRFRSLWTGVGGAELKLAADPALRPGGLANELETQAALRHVLASAPSTTLDVQRSKSVLALNARPADSWRLFLSLASEQRRGALPSGAVFGGGDGGGNITVPQSIDDAHHVFGAGASYADALTSFDIALTAALYRNRIGTMAFDNPLSITTSSIAGVGADVFTQGRMALDPDNDATSARFDFARAFPGWLDARVTATLVLGRLRQSGSLPAPTSLALTGATVNGVPADGVWNTAAALTRSAADARIDTRNLALTASLRPLRALVLTARYRDDSTDNDGEYLACNPQTGQLGRLLNDGSGAAVVDVPQYLAARCDLAAIRAMNLTPDAGDITVSSTADEPRNRSYGLTADWRIRPGSSLTTEFGRQESRRERRERVQTSEDRLKLTWVERSLADTTLRASVAYAERGGSGYRSDADPQRRSAALGPLPSSGNVSTWFGTVDELRKFDLADRRQTTVQLRANFALADGLDAGVAFSGRYSRYPASAFGRNGRDDLSSLSLDANYVAADGLQLHGFYSFQSGRMQQAGAQPAGCIVGFAGVTATNIQQCGAFGGPLFPADRAWQAQTTDRHQVFGAGGRFEFRWGVLELDYTYSSSRTAIDTAHGSGILLSADREALAAGGWPPLRLRRSAFSAGAWLPLTDRMTLLLRLLIESGQVADWHYDGVAANPVPLPSTVYLDGEPQPLRSVSGSIALRLLL